MAQSRIIRFSTVLLFISGCAAGHISTHRRAHRHERSRERRQNESPYVLTGGQEEGSGPWGPWSDPGPCSRSCGGGVTYQERQCSENEAYCTGAKRKYTSCNIQDCPEGSVDYRSEQCAAYNDVEFEEQFYDWIPYTKAENKCQLNCMPRGERFYYRHKDKVADGTLCTEDSLDVCVDGECKPVGCDKLLGSPTREDVCRVCGGDGSSCTTTSGVVDDMTFITGYNDLFLIPAGATNIKVIEKRPSNNYLAIRNKTGHYYLNGEWRIDFPRSLKFAGSTFTYSRKKPFGFTAPESITALGPTNEAIYVVLLYQERNPGIDYSYSIPKGTVHETSPQGYGWLFSEWSPCNTTCGSGVQVRDVWCALRTDSSRAANELCDPTTIPSYIQRCTLASCSPTWTTTAWGPCSVACGGQGTQTRQVFCTQDDGSGQSTLVKDDNICAEAGLKPSTTQTCEEKGPCPTWHVGPWKPCDRLCGDGKQRRDLHCYKKVEDMIDILDYSECTGEKPESEKPCNLRPCDGVDWITSKWSGCSDKCGLAFETRTAYCGNKDGKPFPETMCHTYRKPKLVQNCTYVPCASQWYASQWSACSAKCGTGVQTRSVFCATFEGDTFKKVAETNCDAAQKYEDKQECKVEGECKGEWFYGPFSSCSKPCGGGRMSRKIMCVKDNQTVNIKECSVDNIVTANEDCNIHACGADEIIPVEPTQIISEDYDECEGEDYDYDDVTEGSFIKVDSKLESSTDDEFITLTDKEITKITDVTDEDEGSGGFSEDLISVSPVSPSVSSVPSDVLSSAKPTDTPSTSSEKDSSFVTGDVSPSSPVTNEASIAARTETSLITDAVTDFITSSPDVTDSSVAASSEIPSSSVSSSDDVSTMSSISKEEATTTSEFSTDSTDGSQSVSDILTTVVSFFSLSSESSSELPLSDQSASTDRSVSSEPTSSSDPTDITSSSSTDATTSKLETSSSSSEVNKLTTDDVTTEGLSSDSTDSVTSTDGLSIASTDYSVTDISAASSIAASDGITSTESSGTTILSGSSETSSSASVTVSEVSTVSSEAIGTSQLPVSSEATIVTETEAKLESWFQVLPADIVTSTSTDESVATGASSLGVTSTEAGVSTLTSLIEESSESSPVPSASVGSSLSPDESTEAGTTSYTEAIFSVSTPSAIEKAIKKEQKLKKCKRRPRRSKCLSSEFGCCPDNKTPAKGPFGQDCPKLETCKDAEFGCCPDNVSPAKGPKGKDCPPTYCEQTLFGCCPDQVTAAMGNEFDGCPVEETTVSLDCSSSQFGCCPDGILSASGPDNEGCPSCKETDYGCCPDGTSSALGPDGLGCEDVLITTEFPENETDCENTTHGCCQDEITPALGPDFLGCLCSKSQFGCCPDGNTTATGLNNEGCPTPAPACAGGQYGCCDDNITLAHGPNKEGCCLLLPYGCCPDNIVPARGPNFQGCGCEYSPYGCCPDNRTAARGPSNEGCGCQYTPNGCCPNNYTPAAGPNYQGCPCHTYQFGCCPDGITTAKGPRHQGCGCEHTEFGCCSDGRTPAPDSSQNCTCAASKYGCCLDGVTAAHEEDFGGCDIKPVHKGAFCSLPKALGECRNLTIKWYFDMEYGGCSRFWYGNCGGNGNRFSSSEECKATCVEAKGKERCYLPKIEGPCKSYYPRWYYDRERKTCSQFIYSGCLGNTNRFETREECDELCGTQEYLDACDQKVEPGPCSGNFTRWYFDKETQVCSTFNYGGCQGTKNNFLTESACKTKCLQPGKNKATEVCNLKKDMGPCQKYRVKWYFDYRSKKCKQFFYGGCKGNENRFSSRADCESFCLSDENDIPPMTQSYRRELDTCVLPPMEGELCNANYTEKYFYDSLIKQCRAFYYGGCGGNHNNFASLVDCQRRCDPKALPEESPLQFTQDMCFMGSDTGSCSDSQIRWFYDRHDGVCKQFRYSGCGGNGNKFVSRQECEYSCGNVQDVCALPRVVGPCDSTIRQWHYDQATQSCQVFDYGGCQGNGNRFDSEEECRSRCVKSPEPQPHIDATPASYQNICYFPVDPGPCLKQIPAWFYEPSSATCRQFNYGGCEGNANRFVSEEQCERQCGQFKGQDSCSGEKEVGHCDKFMQKYYFDIPSQSCAEFTYNGCGGNPNRFTTVEECESICVQKQEPPIPIDEVYPAVNQAICSLPIEPGTCSGSHKRWYYEGRRNSCFPYYYTGCAGNLNSFLSYQECYDFCQTSTKDPVGNEINVDESRKDQCIEIERRCESLSGCRYGLDRWVDSAGCSACRCHEPCLTSPPECAPGHSCNVELITNPQTGFTEYRGICRPDIKPGDCPVFATSENCSQECRKDFECPGQYKCCYNGCGTLCSPPRSEEPVTREPHFPEYPVEAPTISDESPSEEVSQEGYFVNLNCITRGRPTPIISWYKGGVKIDVNNPGGGRYRLLENGTLQVIGLEKSDEGSYTCLATNGIEPDATRAYTLTVQVPVQANISGGTKEIKSGNKFNLKCVVSGDPKPRVTWYKDSNVVESSSRITVVGENLYLENVQVEDSGEYKCIADNGYTTAESTVTIDVKGVRIHPNCTDSPFLANCKLIIQARYCNHKFYAKFCCKSCTEAGQLPSEGSNTWTRSKRFIPERLTHFRLLPSL